MTKPEHLPDPLIHDGCHIANCEFGRYNEVGAGTRIAQVQLGDYSYCDRMCDLSNAQIGKFANIASFVRIGATDHPLDRASLHHFMYRSADYWPDAEQDEDWFAKRRARVAYIGNDTWIGHNAQIKPEVRVGHGAVIASGAIVTKDVAPYTIVGGLPASPIRRRLSQELADRMIALAWWDWDHDLLRDTLSDFRSLTAAEFLDRYED
ncbi:MAG: chloramphenicol acetyltransferase [Pseudomonadota bacterium]